MQPARPLILVLTLTCASLALAAPEGWPIEGVVTDERGAPLPGATVGAWPFNNGPAYPHGAPVASATTDATGRYRFVMPAEAPYPVENVVVVATATGRARRSVEIAHRALDLRGRVDVHPLALRAEEAHAAGRPARVQWPVRVLVGGRPAPGVSVRCAGGYGRQSLTDALGRCSVEAQDRDARAVEVEGWSPGAPGTVAVVDLGPAGDVDLPALDAQLSGSTNAWKSQRLHFRMWWKLSVTFEGAAPGLLLTAPVRDDGAFVLHLPANAEGTLVLSPLGRMGCCGNGYFPVIAPSSRLPARAGESVRLDVPDGVVRCRVLGPTGLPLGGGLVRVTLPTGEVVELDAGSDGEAAFWNLPAGVARIEVTEPFGRCERNVAVVEHQSVRVTLELR